MKQIVFSLEQMKHLASLGLDTTDASMYYSYEGILQTCKSYEPTQKKFAEGLWIPAYTLQDILEKLPTHETFSESYANDFGRHWVRLCTPKNSNVHTELSNKSILEAAYNMLVWCMKKNLMVAYKTNKK